MTVVQVLVLAILQGLCELLPVSSSAHVIVAEKLFGLNPSDPAMTLFLVMLHTGTMAAVIVYFYSRWKNLFFQPDGRRWSFIVMIVAATVTTGVVGLFLKHQIEHRFLAPGEEIESLFSNLWLIGAALAAAGVLIIVSSSVTNARGHSRTKIFTAKNADTADIKSSVLIGAIQGLCLPFRGFSRSGATISVALMTGLSRTFAEEFSFVLAVALTPAVLAKELVRFVHARPEISFDLIWPSTLGLIISFIAGIGAIHWLSRWLESGRWWLFGVYCLIFSSFVFYLALTLP